MSIHSQWDGPAGAPVVVLLHNLLTDRCVFAGQIVALRPRFRTLATDLRGHGGNAARAPFRTADLSADVIGLLDAERVARAALVGVSLGAQVALETALRWPERVSALALLAPSPHGASPVERWKNLTGAALVRMLGNHRLLIRSILPTLFGASFRAGEPATVAAWSNKLTRVDGRSTAYAIRAWTRRPALAARLAEIRAPTLVVVGDEDVAHPPPHGEAVAAAISGARLARVARAGHTLPLEQPDAVNRLLLEFLS